MRRAFWLVRIREISGRRAPIPAIWGAAMSIQGLYTNDGPNDAMREAHWTAERADGGSGPGNTTLIYTGQVNLAALGDESGIVTFVEQNDDKTRIYLDGNQILSDATHNNAVSVRHTPSRALAGAILKSVSATAAAAMAFPDSRIPPRAIAIGIVRQAIRWPLQAALASPREL